RLSPKEFLSMNKHTILYATIGVIIVCCAILCYITLPKYWQLNRYIEKLDSGFIISKCPLQKQSYIDNPPKDFHVIADLISNKLMNKNDITTIAYTYGKDHGQRFALHGNECFRKLIEFTGINLNYDKIPLAINIVWDSEGGDSERKQLKYGIYNSISEGTALTIASMKKSSFIPGCSTCYETEINYNEKKYVPIIRYYNRNFRITIRTTSGGSSQKYEEARANMVRAFNCIKASINEYYKQRK
ncbi:MAG TPA: hypothetical protein VM658_16390, partial [bacterium]|nr:hypothetical protein [bacterium]